MTRRSTAQPAASRGVSSFGRAGGETSTSAWDPADFEDACRFVVEGRCAEGIAALLNLARAWPGNCAVAHALGTAYRVSGDAVTAVLWLQKATELNPKDSLSWKDLSDTAAQLRDWQEVARACSQRVTLNPHEMEGWLLLGHSLSAQHRIRSALCAMLTGWRRNRNDPQLNAGIGTLFAEIGRSRRALVFLRRAVELDPGYEDAWTNLVFTITGDSGSDAAQQFHEHRRYGERHIPKATRRIPRPARRSKIRVGYVSGDFRRHALERFYAPILRNRNRDDFEIYLYSNTLNPDAGTERYRAWSDHWRDIRQCEDDEVVRRVKRDRIDVLVDLSGHTRGNRLGIFARHGAPVQVTHCGYPNTTGLTAMDWLITDSWTDPDGAEQFFTEGLLRIDPCFLCYSPASLEIPAKIATTRRPVVFGCFNPLRKISEATLDLWGRVMSLTPGSKLMLKSRAVEDVSVTIRISREFSRRGIAPDRIEYAGFSGSDAEYLESYHAVDIALDPFPYNGATVTCDALWMGVPVVARTGPTHASRVASSILRAAGGEEWIAGSDDAYVRIAAGLAGEIQSLRRSREGFRDRMRRSSLMDETTYVRCFEDCLRSVAIG